VRRGLAPVTSATSSFPEIQIHCRRARDVKAEIENDYEEEQTCSNWGGAIKSV